MSLARIAVKEAMVAGTRSVVFAQRFAVQSYTYTYRVYDSHAQKLITTEYVTYIKALSPKY